MATKKVKAKVGVFLTGCLALMVWAVLYISGLYGSLGDTFWLEFEDSVLGVYEGGIVQYLGVPVGKVSDISVTANNRAHIEIVIDPTKITLHHGVEAQLVLYSLAAGTMAIELSGGSREQGPLAPNSEIPARPSAFAAISTKVEELMDDATSIIDTVNDGLTGMETGDLATIVSRAMAVLEDVETLMEETRETMVTTREVIAKVEERIDPVVDEVLALGADLRETSDDASAFLQVATEKAEALDIEKMGGQVDSVMAEITSLAARLNESVSTLDSSSVTMLHKADNIEFTFRSTLLETTDTLLALEALVKQLKENPSSLVRGKGRIKD